MTVGAMPDLSDSYRRIAETVAGRTGRADGSSSGEVPQEGFPEPEDRGTATMSALGGVEYVEDLIRPGRIVVVSGEEGTGKSYTIDGELCIRVAVAGGALAGTWPVLRTGPVLVLSEMHADDDFEREEVVLGSLGLERAALVGRYFRLPLLTAAGANPALMVPAWRDWIVGWMRERGCLLLVIDTATGATQIKPWGEEIQEVYRGLRLMIDAYPELSIVLLLHMKKPTGRGSRRISDVLGEWGRWCDVVVMMENDGQSLERVRVTTRKRVKHERRIVATKKGGLLVDPIAAESPTKGPKVPPDRVLATIVAHPGMTYEELGAAIGVSPDTASRYTRSLRDAVEVLQGSNRKAARVFPAGSAAPQGSADGRAEQASGEVASEHRSTARTVIGAAVRAAVRGDAAAKVDGTEAPEPAGGMCPRCGADPFLLDFYERHWRQDHAITRSGHEPGEPVDWDEELAERATDDDGELDE